MRVIKLGLFVLLFAAILAACGSRESQPSTKEYVLTTALENGNPVFLGVGDEINGIVNPTLYAEAGQVITVTLVNGGEGKHQILFPNLKVKTDFVLNKGVSASLTFRVPENVEELEYEDGNRAYAALGMKGIMAVSKSKAAPVSQLPADPVAYTKELAVASFQKGGCPACHTIPNVPGAVATIGPDHGEIGKLASERIEAGEYTGMAKNSQEYLLESIQSPDAFLSPACPAGPCAKGVMPASIAETLNEQELTAVVNYLAALPDGEIVPLELPESAPVQVAAPVEETSELTEEEFTWAKQTFFERCAGCHGTLRKGATGPALTPDKTQPKGTVGLAAIIFGGTSRGMPGWGTQGILTQAQTETMAKFLQNEPPAPPELSLQEMKESWQLITPVEQRPTSPQTTRDWENYFIVTLRDAALARTICVIAKENPAEVYKCWEIASYGRAVHMEYNKQGTEVWISVWGDASAAGETGEIVIYDDATLEEKTRIKDLITPTGKFNVFNTVNDIY